MKCYELCLSIKGRGEASKTAEEQAAEFMINRALFEMMYEKAVIFDHYDNDHGLLITYDPDVANGLLFEGLFDVDEEPGRGRPRVSLN